MDYSGYNRLLWKPWTESQHHSDCLKVETCKTKCDIQKMESKLGVLPYALLKLPYFNPIQFIAIDLMYNLFLGTSKCMFSIWIEKGFLSKHHWSSIDEITITSTVTVSLAILVDLPLICQVIMQVLRLLNGPLGLQSIHLLF